MSKRLTDEEEIELAKRIEERLIRAYELKFPEEYIPLWEELKEALEDTRSCSYEAFKIGKILDHKSWKVDLDLLETIDATILMFLEDKRKAEQNKGEV
jgi:hypothetical protein